MNIKFIALFLLIALFGPNYQTIAKQKISIKYVQHFRGDGIGAYNFFTGPDAGDFRTSINGLGSGLLDCFGGRNGLDIIDIGTDKFYVSAGAGLAILKYRLSDNLVFSKATDGTTLWMVDPDGSHDYVNTFFGYGKSKLITTSVYIPVDVNMRIGKNMTLVAGGYLDLNITARYKMKYLVDGDKTKEIIKSGEFRNFNPSTTKFGVSAAIIHKKLNFGLSATYCITPFFESGTGPDIHEARIAATYFLKDVKKHSEED